MQCISYLRDNEWVDLFITSILEVGYYIDQKPDHIRY